ncbi:MAG: hypothetical protein WCH44_12125, partial [Betaproteobacteria bacterium]
MSVESIGVGLPVLALDGADWPDHLPGHLAKVRASSSMLAELRASHPNGWRFSTVARAEAWLVGNADAVTLATLAAKRADPQAGVLYKPSVRTESWGGLGLRFGTPW